MYLLILMVLHNTKVFSTLNFNFTLLYFTLQQKIQTNIEKSLGNSLNIHLQQQMGSFQASMLEAFQSL